ncbi:hypothetical protein Q8A67_024643 [Cirrhinus molitorella]|uniref:Uncharacterized protein n=1 Tax=Cirrhinus molitorella TaxID=172907 RepID=A0AA88P4M2_9TELE|nr:hypothetical protein Q8A67_024643 [Cirrhinus molitorella]
MEGLDVVINHISIPRENNNANQLWEGLICEAVLCDWLQKRKRKPDNVGQRRKEVENAGCLEPTASKPDEGELSQDSPGADTCCVLKHMRWAAVPTPHHQKSSTLCPGPTAFLSVQPDQL